MERKKAPKKEVAKPRTNKNNGLLQSEKASKILLQNWSKNSLKVAENRQKIVAILRLKTTRKHNGQNVRSVKFLNAYKHLKNEKNHCFAVKKSPEKFLSAIWRNRKQIFVKNYRLKTDFYPIMAKAIKKLLADFPPKKAPIFLLRRNKKAPKNKNCPSETDKKQDR